ncbi:MAG: sigma-70 family RNA polymerase sigma factor [Undibacterium sp.]|nr:sigma-70 family RNA polymerase sigma factor [Opitutaceae bacterium]
MSSGSVKQVSHPMSDDAELLIRYTESRSETAFAALVERHHGLVYAAALRRLQGDTHRATEVAQTVFISLARHAPTLAHRPVLASWLHTATRHAVIDILRAERSRRIREKQAHPIDSVNATTSRPVDWDQLRPLLDDALDHLNESDRSLLMLRFFGQNPFTDIGAKLNLTEDAARMRTTRALEKLRAHLARRGITSTSIALGAALTAQPLTAAPAGLAALLTTGVLAAPASATGLSLTLMTATTKTVLAINVIALFSVVTVVNNTARLRAVLDHLTEQNSQIVAVRSANSQLSATVVEAGADRGQLKELERLRGEIVFLETHLKAVKPENTQVLPKPSIEPPFPGIFFEKEQVDVVPVVKFRPRPVVPSGTGGGKVRLDYIVDENGKVRNVSILSATSAAIGESAAASLRGSDFDSAQKDGHPVAVHMQQTITISAATLVSAGAKGTIPPPKNAPTIRAVPWF